MVQFACIRVLFVGFLCVIWPRCGRFVHGMVRSYVICGAERCLCALCGNFDS